MSKKIISDSEKLDILLDLVKSLQDEIEELKDGQERIEEGIANLSLPGSNYETFDVES